VGSLDERRSSDGSADDFDGFVARQGDHIFRVALAIVGSDDADDVAQDVLVIAWRRRGQLRDPDRERAWLDRIIVNVCIDRSRWARRRIPAISIISAGESALPTSPPPSIPGFDPALDLAIRGLPLEQRAVIALHYAGDMPLDHVATAIGIPVGTAKSRLAAALERLRRDLSERRTDGS
jgi:RNA polymerase sigma-70 factor (ECF subfamily)